MAVDGKMGQGGQRFVVASIAVGLLTGLFSGLMGVGGGFIAVPAMVAVLGVSQHRAHGTSLAMIVLTALTSALVYAAQGFIEPDDLRLALLLSVGTVVGVSLGARLMPLVPAHRLRQAFTLLLLVVGVRMIVG